jgi:hypothetical protein
MTAAVAVCSGALPETEWLMEAAEALPISNNGGVTEYIEKAAPYFSDPASVAKLRTLLEKLGGDSQGYDETDIAVGGRVFRLLSFIKGSNVGDCALPILRQQQHPLHAEAAQAAAFTGDERAVPLLEQALVHRLSVFSTPRVAMSTEIVQQQQKAFDYLRCLLLLGTPKAMSAFERAGSQVLEAAAVSSPATRERFAESIEKLKKEYAQAKAAWILPASASVAAIPIPATPIPSVAPARSPEAPTRELQNPVSTSERRTPIWLWLGGFGALLALIVWLSKRRA